MERTELMDCLQKIFREVFDNNDIILTDSTCAEDIEEWDSLGHVQLIKALEESFSIKLTAREMRSWENVGEMVDALLTKTK